MSETYEKMGAEAVAKLTTKQRLGSDDQRKIKGYIETLQERLAAAEAHPGLKTFTLNGQRFQVPLGVTHMDINTAPAGPTKLAGAGATITPGQGGGSNAYGGVGGAFSPPLSQDPNGQVRWRTEDEDGPAH